MNVTRRSFGDWHLISELEYLEIGDFLLIAEAVTGIKAELLAEMPRVVDLASSALAVPRSGWRDKEAYPEFAQKAGLLASRLAKNHPLPDGNKRAAWLALIEFVERNGYVLAQPETDEAVDVVVRLASGDLPEADFVDWVRSRLTLAV